MESVTLTLGGLPTIDRYGAEVSRSHSRSKRVISRKQRVKMKVSRMTEGRNVRMAKKLGSL